MFAEDEAALLVAAAPDPDAVDVLVARRVAGEPLEPLLGWVEFRGLRIGLEPGVFVPRRRTEFLVERAALATRAGDVVVDLCCGCGAVGVALAAEIGPVELHAVEIDPVAARCAAGNLAAYGGHAYTGDLYTPLPDDVRGRVDVLVANAPYVPTAEIARMPAEARDHEPAVALDGGPDGLDVARRVVARAAEWLKADGILLIETSDRQAPGLAAAMSAAGLDPSTAFGPEELNAVVVEGRPLRPASARPA